MLVLGMMSGTSADGIDAAVCHLEGEPAAGLRARVLWAATIAYTAEQRARILAACRPESAGVDVLARLNADLGAWFGAAALHAVAASGHTPDLIASHGQTVWHDVGDDGRVRATLQIGEACAIAEVTGITTVSNFRARDVAAGGQGAPLVGYADWLLLRHPQHWRAVQNIGGIANVTLLPPLNDSASPVCVFDTGPGNAVLDAAVSLITDGSAHYDRDGALAAAGRADEAWLDALMSAPYFARTPPKSTGRERFGAPLAAALLAEGRARGLSNADIAATLTAWTAASIAAAYRAFAPAPIGEVIVGGGGVHNPTLMALIGAFTGLPVLSHEAVGLSSDAKEALAFALLGYETWHARPGTLPAQTGARHASVLGQITPGANYPALSRATWG